MPANILKIVIVGGPRSGKTSMAKLFGVTVRHTDDLKNQPNADIPRIIAGWFNLPGSWLVEGVWAARGLRRWLREHPSGKPADLVLVVEGARLDLTPKQEAMRKGSGMTEKSSSTDPTPMASSISRSSASVLGIQLMPWSPSSGHTATGLTVLLAFAEGAVGVRIH